MFSIKFLIKYITLFILILPFTGCTARMDIKTDNAQPMLSVYGMITGLEEIGRASCRERVYVLV